MKNVYAPSYYQILEVATTATAEEIKSAYRNLMKLYHEDKNPGDPTAKTKSQEINEANDVLSDSDKRLKYNLDLTSYLNAEYQQRKKKQQQYSSITFFNFAAILVFVIVMIGLFEVLTTDNKKI